MARTVHTNDLGVAISSAIDLLNPDLEQFEWKGEDGIEDTKDKFDVETVDASHGYSDLRVHTSDGSVFRVVITREA